MFKYWVLFLLGFIANKTDAQIALRAGWSTVNHNELENQLFRTPNDRVIANFNQFNIAIDYRKRITGKRIEFYPALVLAKSNEEFGLRSSENTTVPYFISYTNISLALNTHFYILDMAGDCDCPTWGKEGGLIKKGFFLHIAPEIGTRFFKGTAANSPEEKNTTLLWGISGGAGLDIGITAKITLTPIIRVGYYGHTSVPDHFINEDFDRYTTTHFGGELRLGYEF